MTPRARASGLALAVCAAVLLADQATKAIARAALTPGESVTVLGPLQLTEAHNSGVAFGLADGGGVLLLLATGLALAAVLFLFYLEPERPGMALATGLLLGGALGNLVDRIVAGEVTDFIDLPLWPTFNLADVAITAGVVILAVSYLHEQQT